MEDEGDDSGFEYYQTANFCQHWADHCECEEKCADCEHLCANHNHDGACEVDSCVCKAFKNEE